MDIKYEDLVFVIGVCAHGSPTLDCDYIDKHIRISDYHLSAAAVASRVATAFENIWKVY